MNLEGQDWFDTWRLRALAASVSAELQDRFGVNEFYPPEQVLIACDARQVVGHSRGCALAMFAEPGNLHDMLMDYGISDPADDMRRMMAKKISYSDTSGIDCSTFDFHSTDIGSHHSSDFGSSSGDSGGDGGGTPGE